MFVPTTTHSHGNTHESRDGAPAPTWSGFDVADDIEAFLAMVNQTIDEHNRSNVVDRGRDIIAAEQEISNIEARLHELRDRQQRLIRMRADHRSRIDALRSSTVSNQAPQTTSSLHMQLEAMRQLPGVLGIRCNDEALVVHVRTLTVYRNQLYDLGDYEIEFSMVEDQFDFSLRCTRSARKPTAARELRHPYWQVHCPDWTCHQDHYDDLGPGYFCFGSRSSTIMKMLEAGELAQALQVMIASMCKFNRDDLSQLEHFNRLPLTKSRLDELLALKAAGVDLDIDEHTVIDDDSRLQA